MKRALMASVVTGVLFAAATLQSQSASLAGAWRITEVRTTGTSGTTNRTPQPGMFLFTSKHYAIVRDASEKPRGRFKDLSHITAQEAYDLWYPVQAQSGSYEVRGDTLVTHIIAAKNPENTTGKVSDTYKVKVSGNTLTITTASDTGQPVPNPTTYTLTRLE